VLSRSSSIFLIISARTQRVLYVGDSIHTILGYDAVRFLGRSWEAVTGILVDEYRKVFNLVIGEYLKGRGRLSSLIKMRSFSGKAVDCEIRSAELLSAHAGERVITCRFASKRERARPPVAPARPREGGLHPRLRRDIARELHETMAQDLFLCKGKLIALRDPGRETNRARLLADALSCLDETTAHFRSVLSSLPAIGMTSPGLRDAMMGAMRWARKKYGLEVTLRVRTALPLLDNPANDLVLSATRELLTNVYKHSGQRTARVVIGPQGDGARLDVVDFGSGMEPAHGEHVRRTSPRLGLSGIRKRAEKLGGGVEIESSPGTRTRVSVFLPRGG
jgi:signal transduction histidine kinase